MKKITTVVLFTIVSFYCFGQKWHLEKIDVSNEFPYEYWFNFDNKKDISSHQLTIQKGNDNSVFEFHDNKGNILDIVNLKLTRKNFEKIYVVDYRGKKNVNLNIGKYSLEVTAIGYDDFNLEFEIKENQHINLKVKLGLAPELKIYQIISKIKLDESEVKEIMYCTKTYKDFVKCCEKNEYQIKIK